MYSNTMKLFSGQKPVTIDLQKMLTCIKKELGSAKSLVTNTHTH